jgi:glycosyltransferase involved in cell wall biosynthesis
MPDLAVTVEQCLAPVPGGAGRYAREITTALAARPRPGWTVRTISAWHRDVTAAVIAGADGPHRLPAGHRALSELWRRGLPPAVRAQRVHATTPLAPLWRRERRGGLVGTVFDAVPWTHPETLTPRGVAWHRDIIGRTMATAQAVVVLAEAVADDLAGLFPAASDRIVVIPPGVTPLPPPPDAPKRRRRWQLPDRYVLSVATLEPRKGLDVLVRALAEPVAAGAHLVVVGSPGWGGVDLPTAAAAAGLPPDRVHVLGRITDDDLAAVMQGAAVLAAPSRSEGFGLPVLEAMAAGLPVICSDAPALVELTAGSAVVVRRDDVGGLAQAISDVLHDDELAAELSARGTARAAPFRWDTAAAAIWDLHERLGHR